jgi:hypothetical protein
MEQRVCCSFFGECEQILDQNSLAHHLRHGIEAFREAAKTGKALKSP